MKIWILTMEDPLYTLDFIKDIISVRHQQIAGITIARGERLKIGKKKSRMVYLCSLLLIMGPLQFVKNVSKTLRFKFRKKMSKVFSVVSGNGLEEFAHKYEIPVDYTENPNKVSYLEMLREEAPDVIINQSQFILQKSFLQIPSIGVINRHNALLPKNRGRLTPFWVLFKGEKETGVSIHIVNEGIDGGPIIVQKKFPVEKGDTFNTVVEKNYALASEAMLEALTLLERGKNDFFPNRDEEATYNTVPTFKDAVRFRSRY